jgi:hypothetical protein
VTAAPQQETAPLAHSRWPTADSLSDDPVCLLIRVEPLDGVQG